MQCPSSSDKGKKSPQSDIFIYNENGDYYMVPTLCKLFHYRIAAIICSIVEVMLLAIFVIIFLRLDFNKNMMQIGITFTLVIYGIASQQANYLLPQLLIMSVEISILLILATISIISMSMGIQTTYKLFGMFINVRDIENSLGPIWPFNMAILSFFSAAMIIWFHTIVHGAYDYLLDKNYFTRESLTELSKK
ncbi:unnamed protein product [Dracunculus medinensis]|uniref:MARVEL domain-containing protein n=1 Tax=Dracunculus medinensis TaxID=318479 RepID=A0A0N4UH03_DRAME|nr:unnamed protein product [Dracunculus medinensis]